MSSLQQAFNDWYFNGPDDTWWCERCQLVHMGGEICEAEQFAEPISFTISGTAIAPDDTTESLAAYEESIRISDEISTFALALNGTLVSDDTVDMDMWRSLHSADVLPDCE